MTAVREVQVTFDCADPAALSAFWAEALGYVVQPPPPGFDTWDAALEAWGVPPEARNSRSAALCTSIAVKATASSLQCGRSSRARLRLRAAMTSLVAVIVWSVAPIATDAGRG